MFEPLKFDYILSIQIMDRLLYFKYSNYGPIVYIHQNFLKVVAHVIFIDQWNQITRLYEIQLTVINDDLVYKFRKKDIYLLWL